MNTRSKGMTVVLVVLTVSLVVLLGNYFWDNSSPEPEPEPVPPKSIGQVKAGKTVLVVEFDGKYALIEKEGGQRGYVSTSKLMRPSEIDNPSPQKNVRVLSIDTELFETLPTFLPPASPARAPRDIEKETRRLSRIYLTERTLKRVIAPMSSALFTDPATGEKCFPAYACDNFKCPEKRKEGEEPYLFIIRARGGNPTCPACRKSVRPYVLPETAARLKEIEVEQKQSILDRKARRKKYGPMMKKRKNKPEANQSN